MGVNCKIAESAVIREGVRIGDNVTIGEDVFLDYDVIIRDNVVIGNRTTVGARCILGEYLGDFYEDRVNKKHPLVIGDDSLIRSGTIIYGDNAIGDHFQTGHRVTIRENSEIGHHVRIGTLSDVQGFCKIGNYVNIHSNVHVGQESLIEDYVWLFPYVVLTNDPTPPSETMQGVTVKQFAVVATGSVLLPGVVVEKDSLVGAGSVVTRDVQTGTVVVGNPAKMLCTTDKIRSEETGEPVYPWRYTFDRGMPWRDVGFAAWEKETTKTSDNEL